METSSPNSTSQKPVIHFSCFIAVLVLSYACFRTEAAPAQELLKGFEAKPDNSISSFQPVLTDPTGNFSFGFLRINRTRLSLAVLHVTLPEPLWVAGPTRFASWSDKTHLAFNGSLVISDPTTRVVWSSNTDGDRVVLRNDSNLQIEKMDANATVVWQSFDFPGNTLVENQNFTSAMTLVSSNGLYSMRLGNDFIGLYAAFKKNSGQMYWQHKALEAKAKIIEGKGPIYALVNPNGYLGMYQTGNYKPVDVEAFTSFQYQVNGLLILRLEPDGNLKGYYWDGTRWALNYQAIADTCELPDPCGPYGLCTPGSGCSGESMALKVSESPEDFCGGLAENEFRVVRRRGVELPFKELMEDETAPSLEQCEGMCRSNCSCWGAVYNNGSGSCYLVDYPIRTVLSVGDVVNKMGYFKVREGAEKKKTEAGLRVGIGLLCGFVVLSAALIGFAGYRIWRRKRLLEEDGGLSPGPYKDLASASFRSIEMGNR